jgi:poly-gamma-glutamate synthesis protein (capsule biosynthesis protein)
MAGKTIRGVNGPRRIRFAALVATAAIAAGGADLRAEASAMPAADASPLAAEQPAREFRGSVERLPAKLRRRMTGVSWHRGCPVGLGDLRLLKASHIDFHGRARQGRLVVNEDYAKGMLRVLRRLYAKRFPVRRMELIDRYGGDDHRSMHHDNTSAFNCRFVNGTTGWSMHAYGKAIDINPRENPYVSGSYVSPPEGRPYADRSDKRKGMLYRHGTVARAMKRIIGWKWAGNWPGARDYQHFSSTGH